MSDITRYLTLETCHRLSLCDIAENNLTTPIVKTAEPCREAPGLPSGVVDMSREDLDRSIVEDATGDNYSPSASENEDNETLVSARIPKNERGEPMYEAVDAQTAWEALVEQSSGDIELASEVARIMVDQKRAEVERISREPKGKEKPKGTPQEIMHALQDRKTQMPTQKQS